MAGNRKHSRWKRAGAWITGGTLDAPPSRPRFFEKDAHPWHLEMVEKECDGDKHPVWTSAVFTVHGIGSQSLAETSSVLRSGFDDALVLIRRFQADQDDLQLKFQPKKDCNLPPPYISDGFWANYDSIEETFPDEFEGFAPDQQKFFRQLWEQRTHDTFGTVLWFLRQQLRLLTFRTLRTVGLFAYLLYVVLQFVIPVILVWLLLKKRDLINGFLADVRLYADPRGVTERAIVQQIDNTVAEKFMKLLGLKTDFTNLDQEDLLKASGTPLRFKRVVWVAHSLGSVISYNVLSDLFKRADDLALTGTETQKKNVQVFRKGLRRFVTIGSPLDKFAFLFPGALRPWMKEDHASLLDGGDWIPVGGGEDDLAKRRVWWVNYFHVLDPVSGALSTRPMRSSGNGPPPVSIHIKGLFRIPGAAHMDYWKSTDVLRYVLGRTFGKAYMADKPLQATSKVGHFFRAVFGYLVWILIVGGSVYGIIRFLPTILEKTAGYVGGLFGSG